MHCWRDKVGLESGTWKGAGGRWGVDGGWMARLGRVSFGPETRRAATAPAIWASRSTGECAAGYVSARKAPATPRRDALSPRCAHPRLSPCHTSPTPQPRPPPRPSPVAQPPPFSTTSATLVAFLATRPNPGLRVVEQDPDGAVRAIRAVEETPLRVNGGFFVLDRDSVVDVVGNRHPDVHTETLRKPLLLLGRAVQEHEKLSDHLRHAGREVHGVEHW